MPDIYTSFASIVLLAAGFIFFPRPSSSKINRTIFCLISFFYILLYAGYKAADYFTGNGIDQATIILLKFGLRGAAFGAYVALIATISAILAGSILFFTIFIFKQPRKEKQASRKKNIISYGLLLAALLFNPATINIYKLPVGTFIPARASSKSAVLEFYKYYTKPWVEASSTEHKNLVFIYAESLEQAFFNEDVFPGLVVELKDLEKEAISFSNMYMADGTGGTIWAVSSSQCGIPLYLPNLAILNKGSGKFLSSATCFGDLLKDEGYYLTYYGGASLGFTGKGNFYRTHGFTDVYGKEELKPLLTDPEYLNFWGLYDDSLFDITYKRFLDLSEKKQKFGIFLLTVDTHSPGYSSASCADLPYRDGKNRHLNSVRCSDHLIRRFIRRIVDSPFAENTVIVLASDHVNWNDAPSADLLKKARNGRKNIFMIIEPGGPAGVTVQTRGTAFDIGTTLLPFLGYDGQIGLGRNLFDRSEDVTKERKYMLSRLHAWKTEILKFWGQPRVRKSIDINIAEHALFIDNKKYKIPIFIELTDKLDSALLFGFNGTCEQHLKKMDPKKRYLMVGECRYIKTLDDRISDNGVSMADDGWCLITGKGEEFVFKTKLTQDVHLDLAELKNLLGMSGSSPTLHLGKQNDRSESVGTLAQFFSTSE